MREPETIAEMRRELGHQLAARRKAAGYAQRELGARVGYSRTAIANAETGAPRIARHLWERADQALGTGGLLTRGYDQIQARTAAESQAGGGCAAPPEKQDAFTAGDLKIDTAEKAQQEYRERDWPAAQDHHQAGRLWLMTGTAIDALEVSRPAGIIAMSWWLYTRGAPDQIRGLPALPEPTDALAMIVTGSQCYFLTQPGMCPWTSNGTGTAEVARPVLSATVRWHADSGRIPAPPSPLGNGEYARWAHIPRRDGTLVSPVALLHLLAYASAMSKDSTSLTLPGGVRAVPAAITSR